VLAIRVIVFVLSIACIVRAPLSAGSNSSGFSDGTFVAFSETVLSLLLPGFLVSCLPAIYGAFSQRGAARRA
jgi:hypothetical protein